MTEVPASKPSLPVCGPAMLIPILALCGASIEATGRSRAKEHECS